MPLLISRAIAESANELWRRKISNNRSCDLREVLEAMAMRRAWAVLRSARNSAAAAAAPQSWQGRHSAFSSSHNTPTNAPAPALEAARVAAWEKLGAWPTWPHHPPPLLRPQPDPPLDDDPAHTVVRDARKLLRLVHVEAVKQRLLADPRPSMPYTDLLELCQSMGVASSTNDATEFASTLDDAGVVLIFRDSVYLNPKQVAELVANVVPPPYARPPQLLQQELSRLQHEKQEIDKVAHKHARTILWSGLGYLTFQTALFFRLTFWDLSWDVMEPIAYFATTIGILGGYAFFLLTSSDPTYQDLLNRLLSAKQRKLIKKRNFDMGRLAELQQQLRLSGVSSSSAFVWQQAGSIPTGVHGPYTLHS